MLKQAFVGFVAFTALLAMPASANAANLTLNQNKFNLTLISNNPQLGMGSGTFEVEQNSSLERYGIPAFTVAALDVTTPIGKSYSLADFLPYAYNGFSVLAFTPSSNQFNEIVFKIGDRGPEVDFVLSYLLFPEKRSLPANSYFSLSGNKYSNTAISPNNSGGVDFVEDNGTFTVQAVPDTAQAVPEPSTLLGTLMLGGGILAARSRRRALAIGRHS